MTTSGESLEDQAAANVRAEMAVQRKTAIELAGVLGLGHRAALHRVNGSIAFSLRELDLTARWLGVSVSSLLAVRQLEAVAS